MKSKHIPKTGWNDLDPLDAGGQTRLSVNQKWQAEKPAPSIQQEAVTQQIQEVTKELTNKVGMGGSLKNVNAGGVVVGPGLGVSALVGGVRKSTIEPDGDVFFGSGIETPEGTSFAVFVNEQYYNGELMEAGDFLIGNNSEGSSNAKWNASEAQLQFRFGQIVNVYVDTDGKVKAGGGNVILDANGIIIKNTNAVSDPFIIFRNADNSVLGTVLTNTVGNLELTAYGYAANSAERKLVLRAQHDGGAVDIATIEIISNTSNSGVDWITLNSDFIGLTGAVTANGNHGDMDFKVNGDTVSNVLMVDASQDRVQFGNDHYIPTRDSANKRVYFNEANQDMDFSIEGVLDSALFYLDASTDRIGIGKNNPAYKLDVVGDVNVSGGFYVGGVAFTGGGGLTYNATTVTTTNVSAAEGNHYDCTIAGLTADRDFNLPTPSAAGKKIALRILDGDDTYELIIKANSVEITRLFIAGEYMEFMSTGTGAGDWKASQDGRIPCLGEMDRITTNANTTNGAGTKTTVDWNNAPRDRGNIADLTNDRFNIRRAGTYKVTFVFRPAANITDQKYLSLILYGGAAGATEFGYAVNRVAATGAATMCNIPGAPVTCAVGDQIVGQFATEEANIGMLRNDAGDQSTGGSWISIEEVL